MLFVLWEHHVIQYFPYVPQALVQVVVSYLLSFIVFLFRRGLKLMDKIDHIVVCQMVFLVEYEAIVPEKAQAFDLKNESIYAS